MQTLETTERKQAKPTDNTPTAFDHSVIKSEELFKSSNVIYIQHQNGMYQLRETKSGKLILTK